MDIDRLKRYKDKIEHAEKRMNEINEWIDEFEDSEKTMLACYKAFEEVVECCMDILAMICKDLGSTPKDDYSNIELIKDKKIITGDIAKSLRQANGLRNRVVHAYNGTDKNIAHKSMLSLLPELGIFLEVVEKWLKL